MEIAPDGTQDQVLKERCWIGTENLSEGRQFELQMVPTTRPTLQAEPTHWSVMCRVITYTGTSVLTFKLVEFFPDSLKPHVSSFFGPFAKQTDLSTSALYSNHFHTLDSFFRPANIRDKLISENSK